MTTQKNDAQKSPIQKQYDNACKFCTAIAVLQLFLQVGLFVYLFNLTGRMEQDAITVQGAAIRGGIAVLTLLVTIGVQKLAEKQRMSIKQVIDRSEFRRQQRALEAPTYTVSDFLS